MKQRKTENLRSSHDKSMISTKNESKSEPRLRDEGLRKLLSMPAIRNLHRTRMTFLKGDTAAACCMDNFTKSGRQVRVSAPHHLSLCLLQYTGSRFYIHVYSCNLHLFFHLNFCFPTFSIERLYYGQYCVSQGYFIGHPYVSAFQTTGI